MSNPYDPYSPGLPPQQQQSHQGPVIYPRTSGQATASLILGLLSPFCFSLVTGLPAMLLGILALRNIGRSNGQLTGTVQAGLGIASGLLGSIFGCLMAAAILLPAVDASRQAARRTESMSQLRKISIAMEKYRGDTDAFPAAGSESGDFAEGRGLSWRVHLLPYLDEKPLYDEFHLDEPWDSLHNKSLLSRMPEVYRSPVMNGDDQTTTIFLGVVRRGPAQPGATTFFGDGNEQTKSGDLYDTDLETIMIVEADKDQAVPWTKPADFELDVDDPRRGLGGNYLKGFNALKEYGDVVFLTDDIDNEQLLKMFLRDDEL